MVYTKEDCIESLKEAEEKLGKSPTVNEYNSLDISPSYHVIQRRCGSWNEAKEAASMKSFTLADSGPSIDDVPKNISISQSEWMSLTNERRTIYRKRAHVNEIKVERGCSECGFDKSPVALSFHHINPESKNRSVSDLVSQGYSYEIITDEISKCELLCANCHRIREYS